MGLSSAQYTTLFEVIGEYVERINDFEAIVTALEADRVELNTELLDKITNDSYPIETYSDNTIVFDSYKYQVVSWIAQLVGKISRLLSDRTIVLDNFVTTSGWEGTYLELYRDMKEHADGQRDILPSTVTLGSPSYVLTNSDAFSVATGKVLDGYQAAINGGLAHKYQDGVDSQLAPTADTMRITCVKDSDYASNVSEGNELFEWGGNTGSAGYTSGDVGSGAGPSMYPLTRYGSNYGLSNLDFETWSSTSAPGTWVDSDHPPTRSSDAYKGTYALGLVGTPAGATFELTQAISSNSLHQYRRYCLACYVKGQSTISAGVLEIKFTGTGYTASSSEKISMDATALAAQTAYGVEFFFINMPTVIPDDFKLSITITPALTNAKTVLIDHMQFGPVFYHGGVHANVIDGSAKTLFNDRATFTVANDDAGKFQTMFRKGFRMQLPSDASPFIADSLASD